jgi:hypothetical protein
MAAKKKTKTALVASQPDPQAPLDAAAFLAAAQRVLVVLRDDLLRRADESPGVAAALRAQWESETAAKRTGDAWEVWRRRVIVQIAAAWVLSLVFVRTLEDRGLLERSRIAGPGAMDSQEQFRGIAPYLTERDYLLTVFRELSNLPAAKGLFDPAHNPVWKLGPSIEGARALLDLFRAPEPEAPAFRFGQADTRFLGDLYQSLDEETQERFALLQTPHFVESYILDRTLERAIARFGLDDTNLIDPTCGSGHFLLGAFERLVDHRLRKEPGLDVREASKKALDGVFGADVNPYAIAIARFRLTLAALDKGGYRSLADAPAFPMHLAVADSLLHNPQHGQAKLGEVDGQTMRAWEGQEFALEDEGAARDVLHRRFAAVVGNPPYIMVKDAVLRERYRAMYKDSAAGKYSLAAPFAERFFQLARASGFVGMITANSFMKREFGKKLIEDFLPRVNVDGVVNTSGAYIPGHGTPTVLLFGTNESKQGKDVLTVLAKRGEPSTPDEPERGFVWVSIADHGDKVGFENEYISVARVSRDTLEKHPWSLGGGGAAELKAYLEERAACSLGEVAKHIGISAVTGEDDVYLLPRDVVDRLKIERTRPMLIGEEIRDWSPAESNLCLFPYDSKLSLEGIEQFPRMAQLLWKVRAIISKRKRFGTPMLERGLSWYELQELYVEKLRTPLSIAFAFVATHNHFVLDRGGKVFNRSAPIIKLKEGATEEDHLALLAYLNSSTACFFCRQILHSKGAQGVNEGHKAEEWEQFLEFSGTQVATIPLPPGWQALAPLAREMTALTSARIQESPLQIAARASTCAHPLHDDDMQAARTHESDVVRKMVALQERLDFEVYRLFGLIPACPEFPADTAPGARAFEVQLVRDATPTAWFERHGYNLPKASERALDDLNLPPEARLIEQPTFKRRWVLPDWQKSLEDAVYRQLQDLLERQMQTSSKVLGVREMERQAKTPEVVAVGSLVMGADCDPRDFVTDFLAREAVPFLAAYRHTASGLEKHAQWQRVWSLQRAEDRGEKVPPFDPPPKYDPKDYRDPTAWRLRGKLDVPKERFISYPGCESDEDKEPVYGWAGWNHLQQAIALATLYLKRKQGEAWGKERLIPMLAGLDELLPWIWQWHPDPTPESGGMKPGQYIADFLSAQCQELGVTLDEVRAWRPESNKRKATSPAKKRRSSGKTKASPDQESP